MTVRDDRTTAQQPAELDRRAITALASSAPKRLYDARFRGGYQAELEGSGYDACVLAALSWALDRHLPDPRWAGRVLDYGCGQGRYIPELARRLPQGRIAGSDISEVALGLARRRLPDAELLAMEDERVPLEDGSLDLVVAIEVIEHVPSAVRAAAEFARLLRPGGLLIASAPCANRFSAAWIYNLLSGGFERTADGYGRFATDEPAHLRRLAGRDALHLLDEAGLAVVATRFWGHLATSLADNLPGLRSLPLPLRRRIALLDWRVARRIPNGAAMIVVARRR